MDVFNLRDRVVGDYGQYVRSFIEIRDKRIEDLVDERLNDGFLWPQPLVQLNPAFEPGPPMRRLVDEGVLHRECLDIFCAKNPDGTRGEPFRLHTHQVEAVQAARRGQHYVLTTGTGSGKSLSYIAPIVDHCLRNPDRKGIQAIVVYPMNALANSQIGELEKFLGTTNPRVTFKRYTGQEDKEARNAIIADPPDILLTNYVMLELILTRANTGEDKLIRSASQLRFLVLDELHTYRGRQGADVAMLVRRVREATGSTRLLHVGTSATLASGGTWAEQQAAVADVASRLFGQTVEAENIIGETLRRTTPPLPTMDPGPALRERVLQENAPSLRDGTAFLDDPLASWVESTLGLTYEQTPEGTKDRLVRAKPLPLGKSDGAAGLLAEAAGLVPTTENLELCERRIKELLNAGYAHRNEHGRPLFAFRLHQFVSKGESVYASPELPKERHLTLKPQQWVPGSKGKRSLLPMAFCRECGQEYYVVRRVRDHRTDKLRFIERDLGDHAAARERGKAIGDEDVGFLHIDVDHPWPKPDSPELHARLPDSWLDTDGPQIRVKKSRRHRLPQELWIDGNAVIDGRTLRAHFIPAPFLFCLHCRVSYNAHQSSDFGKLATLGSEGRSTATTVMGLSTLRNLRSEATLDAEARKLLSFTDNRQDAALQAGHFNDFVEIALLRSALWRAAADSPGEGLRHEVLTRRVFKALALPLSVYAVNPDVEYFQREETERALRRVLGYYLYRDLRRGWRVTSPNLEQCGLLHIEYLSLERLSGDTGRWSRLPKGGEVHVALATAAPEVRLDLCQVLLDHMRRELAIDVEFLKPDEQESIKSLSRQHLVPPWSLDEHDELEKATIILPRSQTKGERAERFKYLSARGGFGLYLKRKLDHLEGRLKTEDVAEVILNLLSVLTGAGLVRQVLDPRNADDVPGYQLNAAAMAWQAGDGTSAFHDPVRVPEAPKEGLRTNPFFTKFYRADTSDMKALEAREHTAQVPSYVREEREDAFRAAELPLLFCSPTMELGVDIAQLNVVNMRNVPPTPANYAQRSGRAGRSGQPAFVFTYCSAGSPHDQFFFQQPERMVAGQVTEPRLDLANEDLLKAHVRAVWLAEAKLPLGRSLADLLDVAGDDPSLELRPEVEAALADLSSKNRAFDRAREALGPAVAQLVAPEGSLEDWLKRVLDGLRDAFVGACERWKNLYASALAQSKRQGRRARDASLASKDRERARSLRNEAERQLKLLLDTDGKFHSDFYSYRYFASEGFLPGYNFPRLPLSAYLPGRKGRRDDEEFLTRPRFLAVSEFGPQAVIYHEGSKYQISKVILPPDRKGLKRRAVQCEACGYLHSLGDEPKPDLCERCDSRLPPEMSNLFRMENVVTRLRDRINSDEEERFRMGYELKTGLRFARRKGEVDVRKAEVLSGTGRPLATLTYGDSATLWRINMGWRRRKETDRAGFVLDTERGFWASKQGVSDQGVEDGKATHERVVPYVEDTRNCLLVELAETPDADVMASLQSALSAAIQEEFQVEDRELASEPLPSMDDRRVILFYEAAEGGAGVLRQLVENKEALGRVARAALVRAHFTPDGVDRGTAVELGEACESACYDCLRSYFNQRDHRLLDRFLVRDLLLALVDATVKPSPKPQPRDTHLERLLRLCDSELERRWLRHADRLDLRLPSDAQVLLADAKVKVDFFYADRRVAIFVDGPHHDQPNQRKLDRAQEDALDDLGIQFLRFRHDDDWDVVFGRHTGLFGEARRQRAGTESPPGGEDGNGGLEEFLFDEEWLAMLRVLASEGVTVEGGEDVQVGGRNQGMTAACLEHRGKVVHLVDARDADAEAAAKALRASDASVLVLDPADDGSLNLLREAFDLR